MTDSLRDRIAAVLDKHYPQTTGYQDELTDWCQCGLPRDHVADAVIRELGLRRETAHAWNPHDGTNRVTGTRYVTDWVDDV